MLGYDSDSRVLWVAFGSSSGRIIFLNSWSIPDSGILDIQPPKKKKQTAGMMAPTWLVAVCVLENLWVEQVW